jgi:hypothetical protein
MVHVVTEMAKALFERQGTERFVPANQPTAFTIRKTYPWLSVPEYDSPKCRTKVQILQQSCQVDAA